MTYDVVRQLSGDATGSGRDGDIEKDEELPTRRRDARVTDPSFSA